MKKIEIRTKLSLKKQTVANLQNVSDDVYAGITITGPNGTTNQTGSAMVCKPSAFCPTAQCHSVLTRCTGEFSGCPAVCTK